MEFEICNSYLRCNTPCLACFASVKILLKLVFNYGIISKTWYNLFLSLLFIEARQIRNIAIFYI